MKEILAYLSAIYPVSNPVQIKLSKIIKFIRVEKGAHILRSGDVCKNIYFIKSGMLRCYYLRREKEVSAWFMRENDTLVSVDSFYDQVPGNEFIQAIEDCELYYISYYELEDIFKSDIEFNFHGRILTLKYLRVWTRDLINIRMLSTRERYKELLERDPDLVRRVPVAYLASYLGMRQETLSRIRGMG